MTKMILFSGLLITSSFAQASTVYSCTGLCESERKPRILSSNMLAFVDDTLNCQATEEEIYSTRGKCNQMAFDDGKCVSNPPPNEFGSRGDLVATNCHRVPGIPYVTVTYQCSCEQTESIWISRVSENQSQATSEIQRECDAKAKSFGWQRPKLNVQCTSDTRL